MTVTQQHSAAVTKIKASDSRGASRKRKHSNEKRGSCSARDRPGTMYRNTVRKRLAQRCGSFLRRKWREVLLVVAYTALASYMLPPSVAYALIACAYLVKVAKRPTRDE